MGVWRAAGWAGGDTTVGGSCGLGDTTSSNTERRGATYERDDGLGVGLDRSGRRLDRRLDRGASGQRGGRRLDRGAHRRWLDRCGRRGRRSSPSGVAAARRSAAAGGDRSGVAAVAALQGCDVDDRIGAAVDGALAQRQVGGPVCRHVGLDRGGGRGAADAVRDAPAAGARRGRPTAMARSATGTSGSSPSFASALPRLNAKPLLSSGRRGGASPPESVTEFQLRRGRAPMPSFTEVVSATGGPGLRLSRTSSVALVVGRSGTVVVSHRLHRPRRVLELVDDRRVGERGGVAEVAALGDVAEQPPHDLARSGLRAGPG